MRLVRDEIYGGVLMYGAELELEPFLLPPLERWDVSKRNLANFPQVRLDRQEISPTQYCSRGNLRVVMSFQLENKMVMPEYKEPEDPLTKGAA